MHAPLWLKQCLGSRKTAGSAPAAHASGSQPAPAASAAPDVVSTVPPAHPAGPSFSPGTGRPGKFAETARYAAANPEGDLAKYRYGLRNSGNCWEKAVSFAQHSHAISNAAADKLLQDADYLKPEDFLDGQLSTQIRNADEMRAAPEGQFIVFKKIDPNQPHQPKLAHVMVSTGNGHAVGVNNQAIGGSPGLSTMDLTDPQPVGKNLPKFAWGVDRINFEGAPFEVYARPLDHLEAAQDSQVTTAGPSTQSAAAGPSTQPAAAGPSTQPAAASPASQPGAAGSLSS